MDLVSQVSVQIMDLLPQPGDVILDTTPNLRGGTAEAVLLGGEYGRHLPAAGEQSRQRLSISVP